MTKLRLALMGLVCCLTAGCIGNFLPRTTNDASPFGAVNDDPSGNFPGGGGGVSGGTGNTGASGPTFPTKTPESTIMFEPFAPEVYTRHVKDLLIGLSPTDAEVAAVAANPAQLKDLIARWQASPLYTAKLMRFLAVAFQQSEIGVSNFENMKSDIESLGNSGPLLGNLKESIARTVLWLDSQNKPFSQIMSTQTFMMTPPMIALYIHLDNIVIDDLDNPVQQESPGIFVTQMVAFSDADFAAWRPVTIRQPRAGEATTAFDSSRVATLTELVLNTPRQGFFTTPAFFAGCPTNRDNQARVTINQTMITALGEAWPGTRSVKPLSLAALDASHAQPNTPCYTCHQSLDPMRQFFRQAYSVHYSRQTDPKQTSLPGMFAFKGVSTAGTQGIYDLGLQLAAHPDLASAWVQKLCTYANDAPCLATDSEFVRIAQLFAANGSLSQMIRELFASSLVTHAQSTQVSGQLASLAVRKRDHLCPLIAARLHLNDPCGLAVRQPGASSPQAVIAGALPGWTYTRGAEQPVMANDATLFTRSAIESFCAAIANDVVDGGSAVYASSAVDQAIDDMARNLMGLSTASAPPVRQILKGHYTAAMAAGFSSTDSLRSTFVAACVSPAVAGMAQ